MNHRAPTVRRLARRRGSADYLTLVQAGRPATSVRMHHFPRRRPLAGRLAIEAGNVLFVTGFVMLLVALIIQLHGMPS